MSATVQTRSGLVQLLRESGLVTSQQLNHCLEQCSSNDPNAILSHLMMTGLITEYQGRELYAGRNKGFFIGKYKVLRPLAMGGMGVILHCEHVHMHHQVVLKLLPRELNDDKSATTRFYREARAAAAVKHPNVVQAFDVGQEGNWHCIVMEYVDGVNLHRLITRYGVLSEVRAAHYISQAAAGLQCIMTAGLVHRDLKPGNLVLAKDNTVKVLDLGLARFLDQRSDDLTRQMDDETVLGTADFISPEQALHSHDVDIRADIYSLGMSFYFLLTGRFPFKDQTVAGKLMAHQTRMPKALLSRRPDVSPQLDEIITKMIQKKPSQRYATPQEVVDALDPWTQVPLPLPDPEWFTSVSGMFPALPATPDRPTKTSLSDTTGTVTPIKTGHALPVLESAAESQMDDPLAALHGAHYSLSKASKERPARRSTGLEQYRQVILAVAIALPILVLLGVGLWCFFQWMG